MKGTYDYTKSQWKRYEKHCEKNGLTPTWYGFRLWLHRQSVTEDYSHPHAI